MRTNKAILVLSGGQDSTTCGFWAKARGYELHAITFDYGQRHKVELEAAEQVGELLGVASHEFVVLGNGILRGSSPLVNSSAELDQYADHQSLPGGLEKTFVPMRNQLFLTVAANRAYVLGCANIFTGVCQEDSGGYPDCREDFIDAFTDACVKGTFTGEDGSPAGLLLHTPLMNLTKADSVLLALGLDGCYEALAFTHTSYDGQYPPLGHDHATLLRAKGFEEAGVPDPLVLRAILQGKMKVPNSRNYSEELLAQYMPRIVAALHEGRN